VGRVGGVYIFRFGPLTWWQFSVCDCTLLRDSNTICSSILFFCGKTTESFLYHIIFFLDQIITSTHTESVLCQSIHLPNITPLLEIAWGTMMDGIVEAIGGGWGNGRGGDWGGRMKLP
jgi:hypothetical protein